MPKWCQSDAKISQKMDIGHLRRGGESWNRKPWQRELFLSLIKILDRAPLSLHPSSFIRNVLYCFRPFIFCFEYKVNYNVSIETCSYSATHNKEPSGGLELLSQWHATAVEQAAVANSPNNNNQQTTTTKTSPWNMKRYAPLWPKKKKMAGIECDAVHYRV